MKKVVQLSSSLGNLLLVTALLLTSALFYTLQEKKVVNRTLPHYRIAILSYSHRLHIEQMIDGYTTTLDKYPGATFEYKWYTAREDRLLLHGMMKEILSQSYDAILCIGMAASYTFIEASQRTPIQTPLIFTAVLTRIWEEWLAKYPDIRTVTTGTVGEYDWHTRIRLLMLLRPDLAHVIVPYTPPFDGSTEEISKIRAVLRSHGVTLKAIPLEHNDDVTQKITPLLPSTDALLMLRDAVVLMAKEQLIKKCNQQGVTAFSADMESVKAGTAASLCITEQEMGIHPAHQTIKALISKKPMAQIPLIDVGDNACRFIINEAALKKQNVELSEDMLFLFKKGIIIKNSSKVSP